MVAWVAMALIHSNLGWYIVGKDGARLTPICSSRDQLRVYLANLCDAVNSANVWEVEE